MPDFYLFIYFLRIQIQAILRDPFSDAKSIPEIKNLGIIDVWLSGFNEWYVEAVWHLVGAWMETRKPGFDCPFLTGCPSVSPDCLSLLISTELQ